MPRTATISHARIPLISTDSQAIALSHAARYIAVMNSRSLFSATPLTAELIAILSLGLLLRSART